MEASVERARVSGNTDSPNQDSLAQYKARKAAFIRQRRVLQGDALNTPTKQDEVDSLWNPLGPEDGDADKQSDKSPSQQVSSA